MNETTTTRSPLLPDRHPTHDFFVCDIFNAAPKSDMASMEHPIFSLSTKPDRSIRRYDHGDLFVEIRPSADGLATVHDRDILIYCISQVMAAKNAGRSASQIIRFRGHELLRATNRMTNGRGYDGLKAALERLAGTRITTNVVTGGKEIIRGFGLIDQYEIVRETRGGRMQEVEVKLSDWVFNAVEHHEVLTLSRDYFRLRKPIERRIYELGRKHCNRKAEWKISLALLQKKCGAVSSSREFRRLVNNIVQEDRTYSHMPDYAVDLNDDDMVIFTSRGTIASLTTSSDVDLSHVRISGDGYDQARLAAPGWDIHRVEQEWREWMTESPTNSDAAFIGFCRKWFEKRGRPA
ncbi:replication initiator protein A [Roseimaritima multifibrata]|nr:replication initiator protein A [Roseimaritima multifibrata]